MKKLLNSVLTIRKKEKLRQFMSKFFIVKQQDSREPTRCEASWKGEALIVKQQGSQNLPDAKHRERVNFLLTKSHSIKIYIFLFFVKF